MSESHINSNETPDSDILDFDMESFFQNLNVNQGAFTSDNVNLTSGKQQNAVSNMSFTKEITNDLTRHGRKLILGVRDPPILRDYCRYRSRYKAHEDKQIIQLAELSWFLVHAEYSWAIEKDVPIDDFEGIDLSQRRKRRYKRRKCNSGSIRSWWDETVKYWDKLGISLTPDMVSNFEDFGLQMLRDVKVEGNDGKC